MLPPPPAPGARPREVGYRSLAAVQVGPWGVVIQSRCVQNTCGRLPARNSSEIAGVTARPHARWFAEREPRAGWFPSTSGLLAPTVGARAGELPVRTPRQPWEPWGRWLSPPAAAQLPPNHGFCEHTRDLAGLFVLYREPGKVEEQKPL